MKRTSLASFRAVMRLDDLMARAVMPRVAAADPVPFPAKRPTDAHRIVSKPDRLAPRLTWTLAGAAA